MRLFRRDRFAELVERQLDLFVSDHAELLAECDAALRAYDASGAEGAEERYERYLDLVETGRDELVGLRDAYAAGLDAGTAEAYEESFNRLVRRRLHSLGLGIED
jgi:hypothetical protein